MTDQQVTTLFLSLILWSLFGVFIEMLVSEKFDMRLIASPKIFYEYTDLNWFGAVFCFIVIRIISPAVTLCGLVITILGYIISFIKWVFTTGKKETDSDVR